MTLKEYFALPSSPAENSPVGVLMKRILAEHVFRDMEHVDEVLDVSYEEVRKLAKEQLLKASGRKRYNPMTPKQEAKRSTSIATRVRRVPETAKSGVSTKCP